MVAGITDLRTAERVRLTNYYIYIYLHYHKLYA